MKSPYFTFTACAKGNDRGPVWFKYVTDQGGTVVFAKTSKFADTKPAVTAVVGPTDANVLFAEGTTLKWGYAGPDWVMINGINTQPEPPQPAPYENSRAAMIASYADLNCHVEDAEPTTTTADPGEVQASPSSTPAVMSYLQCSAKNNTSNALWPALKGGDPQALKAFVEPRLTPTGSGLGYVDGRKVRVESTYARDFAQARIVIGISAEKVGLEEKN